MTDQDQVPAPDGKLHKLNENIPMPSMRFVLPTLVRDEVNQGLRFFDVWDLVPDWAEDKIGQHIYYAFSDDVPVFPISKPGVPDEVSPETVAQAWSAIMYVGVLGDRHTLAQARREWQLELNKRDDVPSWYKKTEEEIMEQYQKDLWYVPPLRGDTPPIEKPNLSHQPKPGEVPPSDEGLEPAPEQPPVHIPSSEEVEAKAKALEAEEHKDNPQGEPSSEPKSEVENPQETPKELDSHSEEVQPESSPEESSTPKEEESQVEPEAHAEDPQSPAPENEEAPSSESTSETEPEVKAGDETVTSEDPQPSTPESEEAPSETVSESEPDQGSEEETSEEDLPTPPRPKAALATWRKFAEKIGVEVDKSLSRDEIVEYIKSVRPELFKESE